MHCIFTSHKKERTFYIVLKGGNTIKEKLMKAMERDQIVTIIYLAKNGVATKRQIKIYKISDDSFQAFCFLKNEQRTFLINNVLAFVPVFKGR